jgi:hypothetical protein
VKPTHYQITVRGLLSASMASAFDGLTARPSGAGTVLCGEIADQSALYGVIERIESLGLELVAVRPTASAH